ncbi:NUDIX domain-containing protein, partial [Exiguobacterium aestuarii]
MEEKTIEREVIYQGKIFDVEKHVVSLPNGNTSVRELVYHNGAVAVLVIDESDNIVMVEQYRKAFESMSLEIPAGKLEKGEDPVASAERELAEETGYSAESLEK